MIGKNSFQKRVENFLNTMQKNSPEISLLLSRNRKKSKCFTQLWRQWPWLLQIKIYLTS